LNLMISYPVHPRPGGQVFRVDIESVIRKSVHPFRVSQDL